jgi:hypothetical protein
LTSFVVTKLSKLFVANGNVTLISNGLAKVFFIQHLNAFIHGELKSDKSISSAVQS